MPPFDDDDDINDATTPLVSGNNRRRNNSSRSGSPASNDSYSSSRMGSTRSGSRRGRSSPSTSRRCMTTNRILSVLGLLSLGLLGFYFQWKVEQLSSELFKEETQISDMQATIRQQAEVIRRFNNSVTNTDVIHRLEHLEHDLRDTEHTLEDKLQQSEHDIGIKLNQTLEKLSFKVQQAEIAIENEVTKVKEDVEEYVRTTEDQFSMENSFMVYQLAGTFTLLSGLISMWHMTAHLRRFNQPFVQRKILAILWMCPIYSITSWFSLVFPSAEIYLTIIKDFYEAYIIYQFLSFCIAVLGKGDRSAVVDLLTEHADHLTPPFRICGCLDPDPYENDRELANAVLLQCQGFAMQFVFLRPLTTVVLFVLEELDYYGYGQSKADYRSPQFYIILVQNLSVFVAFTGLLKFYHAVDKELQWCRPFAKFLCIKGVVFMTFWQGLTISILAQTTDVGGNDADKWAKSAQNFLICLEMLLFSIAHFYCFPTDEWEEGYKAAHSEHKFGDSVALGDFVKDLKLILKPKPKKKRHATIPEGDDEGDATQVTEGEYDDEEEGFDEDDEARMEAAERIIQSFQGKKEKIVDDVAVSIGGEEEDIVEEGVPVQPENEERIVFASAAAAVGSYGSVSDNKETSAPVAFGSEEEEDAVEDNGVEDGVPSQQEDNRRAHGDEHEIVFASDSAASSGESHETGSTGYSQGEQEEGSPAAPAAAQPNAQHTEEILHPSIFTTVADLALEPNTPKKE